MVYVGVSRVAEEEGGRRPLIKTVVSNGGMLSFVAVGVVERCAIPCEKVAAVEGEEFEPEEVSSPS